MLDPGHPLRDLRSLDVVPCTAAYYRYFDGFRDRVAQKEVFDAFVTVLTFKDDDEALAIDNGTGDGSAAACGPRTCSARTVPHANCMPAWVWINSYRRVNPGSPFGGVGQSGYGREMGVEAMREYTQVKSVWVNVDAQIAPWHPR